MLVSTQCAGERNDGTHGVCGTSDNVNDSNSVEEGLASNDVPEGIAIGQGVLWIWEKSNALWLEIELHQIFQVFWGFETFLSLLCRNVSQIFTKKSQVD